MKNTKIDELNKRTKKVPFVTSMVTVDQSLSNQIRVLLRELAKK